MKKQMKGKPLQRKWKASELKLIWDFAQHDFDRFIRMLVWLDGLK